MTRVAAALMCKSTFASLHPGVKLVPRRIQKLMWLDEQACACKMATGQNAPQGVENVHTLSAGKPESQ